MTLQVQIMLPVLLLLVFGFSCSDARGCTSGSCPALCNHLPGGCQAWYFKPIIIWVCVWVGLFALAFILVVCCTRFEVCSESQGVGYLGLVCCCVCPCFIPVGCCCYFYKKWSEPKSQDKEQGDEEYNV